MMLSSTERGAFKHQQLSSKTLHNDLLGAESQQQLPQGTFHCKVNPYDNTDKPQRVRRHTLGDSGKEKASFLPQSTWGHLHIHSGKPARQQQGCGRVMTQWRLLSRLVLSSSSFITLCHTLAIFPTVHCWCIVWWLFGPQCQPRQTTAPSLR